MRTLILGLGNPILGDDGVGLRVAEALRDTLPSSADVDIEENYWGGLRLMEQMVGYDRAIVIDAICTHDHAAGTILRLSPYDMPTQRSASVHDVSLPTALRMAAELKLPMPHEIIILAIVAHDVLDIGEQLSPAVAAAVPAAVAMVVDALAGAGSAQAGQRTSDLPQPSRKDLRPSVQPSVLEEEHMISPELLRRYPFFACLNDAQQKAVAMIAKETALKAGSTLFNEGQPADTLYLLIQGSVVLCLPTSVDDAKPQACLHVGDINPGEPFGISSLLADHTYTSSAQVAAASRAITIDTAALRTLMDRDCTMGFCLMQQVSIAALERLRLTHIQLAAAQP